MVGWAGLLQPVRKAAAKVTELSETPQLPAPSLDEAAEGGIAGCDRQIHVPDYVLCILDPSEWRLVSRVSDRGEQKVFVAPTAAFLVRCGAAPTQHGLERRTIEQQPPLDMGIWNGEHQGNRRCCLHQVLFPLP